MRRPRPFLRLLVPVLALAVLERAPAGAEAEGPPEDNTSYVRADAPLVREAFAEADRRAQAKDWTAFARALQAVVEARSDAEHPGSALPWVVPVRGTTVYEGAARAAQHRVLAAGPAAWAAAEAEYGDVARALLERARRERRADLLAEVADRFLVLEAGRTALLLLADLALEEGDADRALGSLERLEDAEEVAALPSRADAPWQGARIRRTAAALAPAAGRAAAEAALARAGAGNVPPEERYAPLGAEDRAPPAPSPQWPTTGGAAHRAALGPALGAGFAPGWQAGLASAYEEGETPPEEDAPDLPTPWLPPRAVTDGVHVFVSDGTSVSVFEAREGALVARQPLENADGVSLWSYASDDRRERFGLLEGHALTLGPAVPGGRLLYVAGPEPAAYAENWGYDETRDDRLEALLWTGERLEHAWRVGGRTVVAGVPEGVRLYGAPLLYQGRLWVAGILPTKGSEDQTEAWLLGLDPLTGEGRLATWLGAGTPVRGGRADEAVPSSPAGARGRVVVATSLGILAAVDARDGRVQWALRYDRGVAAGGRAQRLRPGRDAWVRQSGFANEPPLLALERVVVGPTDGPYLLVLFDRPRGKDRSLVAWRLHRRYDFRDIAIEQVVGLHPGGEGARPLLVLVGRGASSEGGAPPPIAVALDALVPARPVVWRAVATTGHGAVPYGRALLTEREVVVPTRHGLVVLDARTGANVATVDGSLLPPDWDSLLPEGAVPFGNLIPLPGFGLLALDVRVVAGWRAALR